MNALPDSHAVLLEWCEIRRWRGYSTSTFYAVTSKGEVLVESAPFRWRKADPPAETAAARAAHDEVVAAVIADGWKIADEPPNGWHAIRFSRPLRLPVTALGEPQDVDEVIVPPQAVGPEAGSDVPLAPSPQSLQMPPAPRPPAPTARDARRARLRRHRWIGVIGGSVALVAIAAAVLPGVFRGSPPPPAAAAPRHHAAPKTSPHPAALMTTAVSRPQRRRVDLRIVAHGNGSWMEIRRRSSDGPVLYRSTLASGQQLHLRGARLWGLFGAAGNLSITNDGRSVRLSGTQKKVFVP